MPLQRDQRIAAPVECADACRGATPAPYRIRRAPLGDGPARLSASPRLSRAATCPGASVSALLVACQRLGVAAKTGQAPAAIVVHGSACGVVRQHIVECGERLLVALERVEDHSVIDQSVGRSGLRLAARRRPGAGPRPSGPADAAARRPDAAHRNCSDRSRARHRRSAAASSRPSLLMQRQRLLDGVGRAQRLRSRLIGHAWITRRSFWPRPDMLMQWRTQRAACHPAFELFFDSIGQHG